MSRFLSSRPRRWWLHTCRAAHDVANSSIAISLVRQRCYLPIYNHPLDYSLSSHSSMPKSRQDRSSHFSMGEDVYLLSKSAVSLNFDDHDGEIFRGNLPANAASYEATPKTTTNVKGFVASQHGHNRWSSVTTVLGLSSLFGPSNDSSRNGIATPTSSRRKRPRRVRIKGIYGFLLHNDFLEEVCTDG